MKILISTLLRHIPGAMHQIPGEFLWMVSVYRLQQILRQDFGHADVHISDDPTGKLPFSDSIPAYHSANQPALYDVIQPTCDTGIRSADVSGSSDGVFETIWRSLVVNRLLYSKQPSPDVFGTRFAYLCHRCSRSPAPPTRISSYGSSEIYHSPSMRPVFGGFCRSMRREGTVKCIQGLRHWLGNCQRVFHGSFTVL